VLAAAKAGALVFDPAMGGVVRDGRIVERPVSLDALRERFPRVGGADCRHTSAATHIDGTHLCPFEMLRRDLLRDCVLAATNPPFSLYRRFVERGLGGRSGRPAAACGRHGGATTHHRRGRRLVAEAWASVASAASQ